MRKIYKIFLTAIFLLIFLILLPLPKNNNQIYDIQGDIQIKKIPPLEERILSQMTIEEKIGQLFIFGFNGTTLNPDIQNMIETKYIGGVLIMGSNIEDKKQVKKLNKDLQSISKLPLFIAIDQEGGSVLRIKEDNDTNIFQRKIQSKEQAYEISTKRSALLKDLGINMNMAPVAEYITSEQSFVYDRTFSGDKQDVAQKVYSALKGYYDSKMISVLKHFPGHDSSSQDSHDNLPNVNISQQEWEEYIYTFKYSIDRQMVDALMIGHIKIPDIDEKPAVLSKIIIDEKLRKEIKYDGVVITDDMQMNPIIKYGNLCNTAKEALLAGNDILLYTIYYLRPNLQTDIYNCILSAVSSGEIEEESINQKVLRILRLKIKYGLIDETTL
jgi:beta-N-acetylhexosaminidase